MRKFLAFFMLGILLGAVLNLQLSGATKLHLDWRQFFSNENRPQRMVKMVISPTEDFFILTIVDDYYYYLMKLDNSGNLVSKVTLANNTTIRYSDMVLDKYGKIDLLGSDISSAFIERYSNDCKLLSHSIFAFGESVGARCLCLDEKGDLYVVWEELGAVFVAKFGRQVYPLSKDALGATKNGFNVAEPLWKTLLGECVWNYPVAIVMGIVIDKAGNLYVGGTSENTWGNPLCPFQGSYDGFLAKLDENGQLVWNTFIGGWDDDIFFGIAYNEQGNVSLVGESSDEWGDPVRPWFGPVGNCHANTFIAQLDSNGQLLWNTFLGNGNEGTSCYSYMWGGIAMDEQANIYVTGVSAGGWGNPLWNFPGGRVAYDGYVAKVDQHGYLLWHAFLPLRMQACIKFGEARPLVLWQGSIYVAGRCGRQYNDNYGYLDKITETNGKTKLRIDHQPPEK